MRAIIILPRPAVKATSPVYTKLHAHSRFSFLDSAAPEDLAAHAAELGMDALALTDDQGLYGAVKHRNACREANGEPIHRPGRAASVTRRISVTDCSGVLIAAVGAQRCAH